jgi:hypothetical protein
VQQLPWLEEGAIESVFSPLFNDGVLMRKYRQDAYNFLELLIAYRATSPNLCLQSRIWYFKSGFDF